MVDNETLVTIEVDPCDIAQLADEDLDMAIAAERKTMEGMSKSDARAWIDKRTRILQRSMMALIAIRNTLAAVDNLPDEILVNVFWALALVLRPGSLGTLPYTRTSDSWLVVAEVCRRWRNIALWTPKLYSFIHARNPAITRTFLRRSGSILVDIYMDSNAHVHGNVIEIKPYFSRVRELQIQGRYKSMQTLVSQLRRLPAPMLESLHLEQTTNRRILTLHESIIIPEIFDGPTPALRRLSLTHVSIPWTSPIYAGLTDLHMLLQHPYTSPSIDTFLQVLENCPLLETLTLVQAGPSVYWDPHEYPPPVRVIDLARLRKVNLHLGRPIDTQYVIAHLVIPSTAAITIRCELNSGQDFSAVLPRDCEGLKGLPHVRCLRVYVEDVQSESIILTGYTQSSAMVLSMSLFVGEGEGILEPRLFFAQLGRFFPLLDLEDLQVVNCEAHLSEKQYIEVLSDLPGLTRLTASEMSPARQQELLRALTMPLGNNETVVCPSLKILRFSGLDGNQEVVDDVAKTCRSRALKGSTVDAVHIADLDAEGVLYLLHDVVSTVNVDGSWVEQVSKQH